MIKGNGRIVSAFVIAVLAAMLAASSVRDGALLFFSTIAGLATGVHLGASRMMALMARGGGDRD